MVIIGALLFLVILSGCGGKVILSDDAVRIRKIYDFTNELKGLYEQRDAHLLDLFSREYLTGTGDVKTAILKDMERFDSISLNLFIDRIEIDNDHVNISIQWNGTWREDTHTYRKGGSMVLLTNYGYTLLITDIRGDSPFGISPVLKGHED